MDLNKPITDFFYKKDIINYFLAYSVLFAFLFITLFQPFKSEAETSGLMGFISTLALSLSGAAIIAASRYIVRWWGKRHTVTYAQLLAWTVFIELIPLTVVYTVVTCVALKSTWQDAVFKVFIYITLLLLLLYALFVFSVLLREKSRELTLIREGEIPLSRSSLPVRDSVTLPFYNEKGELKVTILKENMLYAESADNYIYLWYINKEAIQKMLIRTSLKNLEIQFAQTNVIRCHRSYMINLDHISMVRRDKGMLYAVFDVEGVGDLPVSASYHERVLKAFITTR